MRIYSLIFLFAFYACSGNTEPASDTDATSNHTPEELVETPNDSEFVYDEPPVEEPVVDNANTLETDQYEDIDWEEYMDEMTQDFSFVIIISTPDYNAALERAKDASEKLGYPLDLRNLHQNEETGLSLPVLVCEAICGGGMVEYPQYLPRNDWGDSKYVSIEYSNGYEGFNPGYYMVIVASGEKGDPIIQEALEESQQFYEDAYAKTCGVWMGCGC
jgi:hypothetical protein